jgi:hypothetical protein
MKRITCAIALLSLMALAGCGKKADTAAEAASGIFEGGPKPGRYVGVGIYAPTGAWAKLVQAQPDQDPSNAHMADDQAVIVVVDSRTGEIRSCGDLTGYCIGMNPWRTPLVDSRKTPVSLREHVDDPSTTAAPSTGPDATPAPIH